MKEKTEGLNALKLTKEQAIIISGFTGVTCCSFRLLHEDVEKRLGHSVWAHQFGNEVFANRVEELYREDFLALCYNDE